MRESELQRTCLATMIKRKEKQINFKIPQQVASLLVQETNSCRTKFVIKLYLRLRRWNQNKAECDLGHCVWDTEIKKQKVTERRSAWSSGMTNDSKTERLTHWSRWNYLDLEKFRQGREKLWGKFADVDLLKKKKAEGTRTEKIKTAVNAELKTSSKLILLELP